MINLYQWVRPDEVFYLLRDRPDLHTFGWDWLARRVNWTFADGKHFTSWIVLWVFRWYHGTAKVDGSRTRGYWAGQYGDPVDPMAYVVTTTSKEMFSVRLRTHKPDRERWDNMGGV